MNFFVIPFLQVSCFRKTKARKTARLKISVSRPLMSWFARSSKNCDFSNFSKFLEKSQTVCRNRSFCWAPFLLGTLVPPLTLDVINFSKNCNISQFFLLRASLDISHRGVCVIFAYIISRRDVESNGFLAGVSLTPFLLARLSCFPRTQNPLSFPFQTPATQATDKRVFSNKYYPDRG